MKKITSIFAFIATLSIFSNAYALGYSIDCPQAGAIESYTIPWFDSQSFYTYSVQFKKENISPYNRHDVRNPAKKWEETGRSVAGIYPYNGALKSDYWSGVYAIDYGYTLETRQVEERYRYVSQSCSKLNWV
ncbi:hypothetical protein JYT31_03185 [Beggiatoa alba]|nr:hypothetical protein [Beggiatoa alba]